MGRKGALQKFYHDVCCGVQVYERAMKSSVAMRSPALYSAAVSACQAGALPDAAHAKTIYKDMLRCSCSQTALPIAIPIAVPIHMFLSHPISIVLYLLPLLFLLPFP